MRKYSLTSVEALSPADSFLPSASSIPSSSNETKPLLLNSFKGLLDDEVPIDHKLRDKFRGCLIGALIGDCIGTLLGCDYSVSYTVLGDLYQSLTSLSEDERLLDLHGIDISIGPKVAKELLEVKKLTHRGSLMNSRPLLERSPSPEGKTPPKRHSSGLERRRGSFSRPIEKFSGVTVMTRALTNSYIRTKGLDTRDVAKQLTEDYFLNLQRKFGAFSREIFTQIRDGDYYDPFGPAKKLQGSIGSSGNEAATRMGPVALFAWNSEASLLAEMAEKVSKITSFNKYGVTGGVFQAVAVHQAFNWDLPRACGTASKVSSLTRRFRKPSMKPMHSPEATRKFLLNQENIPMERNDTGLDVRAFCVGILRNIGITQDDNKETRVSILDNFKNLINSSRETNKNVEAAYREKIETIVEFLQRPTPPGRAEVVEKLGNGVKAIESVPSALYSFLLSVSSEKCLEIPIIVKSPVLRSIFYAISLGGDTDSIASMAGAIAGAYWGYEKVPQEIVRVCEGAKDTIIMADSLFNASR